jgi:predicted ArsR family transcriptional regulator
MKTNTGENIVKYIKSHQKTKPSDLAKKFNISRVAIHKQLVKLISQNKIEKVGETPHVHYTIYKAKKFRPHYLWDYDYDELKKTESGRIKILERMINYGPEKGEKIPLKLVRKYWGKLDIRNSAKRLMELLIWGKYQFSPKTNKLSWI